MAVRRSRTRPLRASRAPLASRFLQLLACKVVFGDNNVVKMPCYRLADFFPPDGTVPPLKEREDLVFRRLLGVLREASLFDWETQEAPQSGRFSGLAIGDVFRAATLEDLADFLDLVIAFREGYQGQGHRLAGAFLGWAIQGAPTVDELCNRAQDAKIISKKSAVASQEKR